MELRDGMILEYRDLKSLGLDPANETVLEGPTPDTRTLKNLRLVHVSAGWEIAGSAARYTTGYFAVKYEGSGNSITFRFNGKDGKDRAAGKFSRLANFQNLLRNYSLTVGAN